MAYYPDISHYHPISNIKLVKANCPFVISKATQGTNYVDPTLRSFVSQCEAYDIPYWLYVYLNAGNELEQTKFMVNTCKGIVGKKFVGYALDVEAGNPAANVKEALNWLQGLGGKTMVYTMYSQYPRYKGVVQSRSYDCAWWEARYGSNNGTVNLSYPAHSGCDLHQFTSVGTCPGIGGNVDLNRICGSKSESWFRGEDDIFGGVEGGEEMQCTFQIDGKTTVYWFDGQEFKPLNHIDQLRIIQRVYKAATGRELPHYKWTSDAPWFMRLEQAVNIKPVTFVKGEDGVWSSKKK